MRYRSITGRWFVRVASFVFVFIVAVAFSIFLLIKNYYYSAAEMTVRQIEPAKIYQVLGYNADFKNAAEDYIENFSEKNKVAVWAVDSEGGIFATTSGFEIKEKVTMPDFDIISGTVSKEAVTWTGWLSGQKVMSYTCPYYGDNGNGTLQGALRFMVSLDGIDNQITVMLAIIIFVAVVMFAVFFVSGILFTRSIVNPVKEIGETAKKIAGGDFNSSIEDYPYNDEIGELCDTINEMADKLSESDRMKNDFISTISHELRTPLTAIRGWGETLQSLGDSDAATTKRGMEIIVSESARLNDMVEELLDFSRISSGRMKLNVVKMDYLAELDEIVFSFKDRAIREGVELSYNVPTKPAPGMGDPSRIRQVFINILDNAVKYTEQGCRIAVSAEFPDSSTLLVTVADSGVGIAPEDLQHVKEKFYKANTTKRGSGIGLAVCEEIIKLHNGKLDIDSVYGEGTTVRITLPLGVNPEPVKEITDDE